MRQSPLVQSSLNLAPLVFPKLSVRVLNSNAYADDRAHFDRFAGAGSLEQDNTGRARLIRARHHYLHVELGAARFSIRGFLIQSDQLRDCGARWPRFPIPCHDSVDGYQA